MKKQGVLLLLMMVLAACGGDDVAPTPLPQTVAQVTAEPTVTNTAVPSPLPPPPTVAPAATSTPVSEEPEPTAEESLTLRTMADFGDDRNPLTGELVDDPSVLQRRPLAVKLSNSPPQFVRPQSGLNDADLVYEHTTEGHITRFTAIFYDTMPEKIGPIRSARLIDLELPAMYDAALVFSGASVGVNRKLNRVDFQPRILYSAEPGYYRTGEDKPYEHTLYGDPQGFYQALAAKELNVPPNFGTVNAFSEAVPDGGEPASVVAIDYRREIVEWRYNEEDGRYYRWAGGEPHRDGNTGEQVSAANVVVIAPFHVEDASICEEIRNDQCVALSVEIQLWGTGTGFVLRDGQKYDVTWHRENRNDMLTFTDANGEPFPLKIGNIWVQLVPTWYQDPVTLTP